MDPKMQIKLSIDQFLSKFIDIIKHINRILE